MKRLTSINTAAGFLVLLLVMICSGCVPVSLNRIVSMTDPGMDKYVSRTTGEGYLNVYRGGKALDVRPGMPIRPGDEIETGTDGLAVLRFLEYGTVVVYPDTRVRIGSLEVLFGEIFADVRGLFSTSGPGVIAGVKGTRYLFEVDRQRNVRAIVVDGIVEVNSTQGSWPAVQVQAGNELQVSPGGRAEPRISRADPAEIRRIISRAEQIQNAPQAGFCCLKGRVSNALSNQCAGKFYRDRYSADRGCEQGWCCLNERVSPSLRHECTGRFYSEKDRAERACKPPPEPVGWCCTTGFTLLSTTSKACKGKFYMDRKTASRACKRPAQKPKDDGEGYIVQ